MDKATAQNLVQKTLRGSFDKGRFVYLLKNILNRFDESKAFHARGHVKEKFKTTIKTYERIGTYSDPDGKKIDLLIVYLQKESSIDRARTALRNFVADYLKERDMKDAALVAFVAPDSEDWRFSFVKMEYRFSEQGKVKEEFTPARRYSFLVGKNENSHTAQSRLLPLLLDDEGQPTLKDLEDAFSVEKATREFFEKYRDLSIGLEEALDEIVKQDPGIKAAFENKNVSTVDFAKKLLGQIVFLYFLQKKGWFGVAKGKKWGEGNKQFLRRLFERAQKDSRNYFNDFLEPLFYQALRYDRRADDDYFSQFDCKIPFLNGGLFDPMNDYDWINTDILLSNDIFSNGHKTKEGDGILDVFDRYNFTVKEDEPLEKEVAVDPEMLGKVFENLLEIKNRKSKGTYYTPREIVHYMCQESLIEYLYGEFNRGIVAYETIGDHQIAMFGNKSKKEQLDLTIEHRQRSLIDKKDVETLIRYGESVVEHERRVVNKRRETDRYSFKLPERIRANAPRIDEKLAGVRICDPAVGSGAFVVGMMNEIIRARGALTPHIGENQKRTPYDFKRHAIQNCLYGVDVDSGAIEIAKLRLWLSLIVDEDERESIQPLPNLDYKIVQGNSLLGVNKDLLNFPLFSQLEELKPLYFNETNAGKKQEHKKRIDDLIGQITNGHKDFDFEVYFSEVFHEEKGFDVVTGNPPYVALQKNGGELGRLYQNADFTTFARTGDIYQLFYERGCQLLRPSSGLLAYITSNSWLKAEYGKPTRRYFSDNHTTLRLIELGKDIFESAIVDSSILIARHGKHDETGKAVDMDRLPDKDFPPAENRWAVFRPQGEKPWSTLSGIEQSIMDKMEAVGTPLKDWDVKINRGILTGLNDAFIIDDMIKQTLIAEDQKSAEIIKPVLRGQDIQRYQAKWANLYLLDTHNGYGGVLAVNIDDYPAIKSHLDGFYPQLKKRQDKGRTPYNLRNCAYHEEFAKEKLFWMDMSNKGRFAYSETEMYCNDKGFIMTGKSLKYLCAILNSALITWLMKNNALTTGMGLMQWKKFAVERLPIPNIPAAEQRPFIRLVDTILQAKACPVPRHGAANPSANTTEAEAQIDQLVYALYGLTEEEITAVENI